MGSGWHEWPLILFTVIGQCVVGGVIVMGMAWLAARDDKPQQQHIVRSMFFLWLLMGIGFLASVIHLGSPWRALNSLHRVGYSALSNEIASGALFFSAGALWWLLNMLGKMPQALGKAWLVVTMLLGLLFVWAMTRVYLIETVPTWYNYNTTLGFFLTVCLGGPLLGTALLHSTRFTFNSGRFAIFSALALLVSLGTVVLQGGSLAGIYSSVHQAAMLQPDFSSLQVWRMVLLVAGLGCWIYPLIRRIPPKTVPMLLGFLLVAIGEMLGRSLFYGLHMTVGV
ncbi:MAG TPA: DmsC/YnfH family molybdoenzyme membrane anchor subunit [Klebsiella sp.]|jgi:Tat-targeted selenate reductase subunit YnfH